MQRDSKHFTVRGKKISKRLAEFYEDEEEFGMGLLIGENIRKVRMRKALGMRQ